jgi:ComF family protein
MLRSLLDRAEAALPSQCAVCRAWPSRPLCDACVGRFAQPRARCTRCAIPIFLGSSGANDLRDQACGSCLRTPPPLDACHAAVAYDYPWSALIAQYKFRGQAGWARAFGTLMRSAPWVEPELEAADIVVPMPLARERLAERGFNQAHLLARQLSPGKTDARLLLRMRHAPAQAALDLKARLANVKDVFAVDPLRANTLKGKRVVIVDDVMTSGASLFAAARVLRQAGAARVAGLVLARTDEPA